MPQQHQQAADALWSARSTRRPIAPLRKWLAASDLCGAYEIQRLNHARRLSGGQRVIGRKDVRVPPETLLQPKIEGEIALVLAQDITERDLPRAALARAAGYAAAAFEIVDSAIADWKIALADTVADNASCGALVLGRERRRLGQIDLRLAGMVMSEEGQVVSTGVGS